MEGLPGAPKLRFRHKLSIVLIGLALVPLVAAGVLVLRLLEQNKVSKVDSGLAMLLLRRPGVSHPGR